MQLIRTFAKSSEKPSKKLSHAGIKTTIFLVGMRIVNPSIQLSYSNLTKSLPAKLHRKRRDRWFEAVRSINFSHFSRKTHSILNNFTGISLIILFAKRNSRRNYFTVLPRLPASRLSGIQLSSRYILYDVFWYITAAVHCRIYSQTIQN